MVAAVIVVIVVAAVAGIYYYVMTRPKPKKEIVCGGTLPLTGPMARLGEWTKRGWELAVEKINEEGGILGAKIKLIIYDDEWDEEKARTLYERLCTVDKVDILLGPVGSGLTYAVAPVAEKYGIPMISFWTSCGKIFEMPWPHIYGGLARPGIYGFIWTYYFVDMIANHWEEVAPPGEPKPKTMVLLLIDNVYGHECEALGIPIIEEFGFEILWYEFYDPKTTDFTALALRIKESKPDVLISIGYFPDSLMVARALIEQRPEVKLIYFPEGPNDPEWVDPEKGLGEYGNYMFCYIAWPPGWHKGDADWLREEYYKRYGEPCPYQTAWAYSYFEVIKQAFELAGSLDKEAFMKALNEGHFVTCHDEVDFTDDPTKAHGNELHMVSVGQMIDGKIEVVWPPELATHKPVIPFPGWPE